MIFNNIEFYNVAELKDGVLYRFPEKVCNALGVPKYDRAGNYLREYKGHIVSARASFGCELRFITQSQKINFCFESEKSIWLNVYNGDFLLFSQQVEAGRNEFSFTYPDGLDGLKEKADKRFDPRVWRICPEGEGDIRFISLITENGERISPPPKNFLPSYKLLVYGSSISQGVGTPYTALNYVSTAAQILNIDVLNKSMAGGCFCEKEVVEYLCSQDFDGIWLECGTNIADRPRQIAEERIVYLIDTICRNFPQKQVFLVTPFPAFSDVSNNSVDYEQNFANTRSIISETAKHYPNTVLVDGHVLMCKANYLSADLLHPSAYGHVMTGINVAGFLRENLKRNI